MEKKVGFWYKKLLGDTKLEEGDCVPLAGQDYVLADGVLRQRSLLSDDQDQVRRTFGFKWKQQHTYETPTFQEFTREWMRKKYLNGDVSRLDHLVPEGTRFLDVGVGAGVSTMALFGEALKRCQYLGVDISEAIDQARRRFAAAGIDGEFIQADAANLPFCEPMFDLIFSEGVLHHTDDTARTFTTLTKLLRSGGRIMFYVYARKGPIREFCDDYIREAIADLSDEDAWQALVPLSKFGKALGELDVEVDVPDAIPFLGIPRGKVNIQRLFYYHVFKAFYDPTWSIDEINRNSFDWYRPKNCHRHSPEQVESWCQAAGLTVEHMKVEPSGITTIAVQGS